MTAGLVGQDIVSTFTSPVNGQAPIDANVVKGNDNTIKTAFNTHDADATIHVQSSTNAARPVASVAGRKWLDNDTYRIYYDDGSAWHEIAYFSSSGGTITGNVLVTGTLGVTSDLAVNTSKFTVAAASGNTTIAGTLTLTGAINGQTISSTASLTGSLGVTGTLTGSSDIIAGTTSVFSWNGRSAMSSPADGVVKLTNVAGSDFSRLNLGGNTSSFPAIKRSSTAVAIRLADDSADAPLTASTLTAGTAQSGSGAVLNLGDGTAMQPTFGFSTPGTIVGIDSALSLANASGVYLHSHLLTKQTVATTGSVQGLETWTWAANTSGTVVSLLGLIGNNSASGGGTTTTSVSVAGGGVVSSGSTVTTFDGVRGGGVTVDGVGSVVTTAAGFHAIHVIAQNSGTVGTQYGLLIDDLTQATTNYAIFLSGKNDCVFNGSGAALATTAVVGFPYIPTCAGAPTGVPTNTATGRAPMVYDTTNNKLWIYNSGWKGVVLA